MLNYVILICLVVIVIWIGLKILRSIIWTILLVVVFAGLLYVGNMYFPEYFSFTKKISDNSVVFLADNPVLKEIQPILKKELEDASVDYDKNGNFLINTKSFTLVGNKNEKIVSIQYLDNEPVFVDMKILESIIGKEIENIQ